MIRPLSGRRNGRRLGALVACTAAVAGSGCLTVVAPAHAADAGPVLSVVADSEVALPVTPDPDNPSYLGWYLEKDGVETAEDVRISFDLSGVQGFATTDLDCPHAGAVYTCDRGDIDDPGNSGGIVGLFPSDGAHLGDTGTVTISGTSSNGEVRGATTKVTVGSPELALDPLPDGTVRLGDVRRNEITIRNNGTLPADGVDLRLRTTPGLSYANRLPGCTYSTIEEPNDNLVNQAMCHFDTVVEPGGSLTLPAPVGLRVEPDALFEFFDYTAQVAGRDIGRGDHQRQSLEADSSADMVAVGDTAKGKRGKKVTVTATLRNEGPGWIGVAGTDDQPALMVTIPKGTTAVKVPEACYPWNIDGPGGPSEPGKPQYICVAQPRFMAAGSSYPFKFVLKIGAHARDTSGEVRATSVYGGTYDFDKNHGNDTARLAVDVKGVD